MTRILLIFAAAIFFAIPHSAHAQRVALIIANSNYEVANDLPNPGRDAILIGNALRHFDTVLEYHDQSYDKLELALEEFAEKAEGAELAIVYFAGHGMEGSNANWLIPTDAKLESEDKLWTEAIGIDRILGAIAGAETQILILDACRDYPFPDAGHDPSRTERQGLGQFSSKSFSRAGTQLMVMYSAAPGMPAEDGNLNENSPFARALAKYLDDQSLSLHVMPSAVQEMVQELTEGFQRPFVTSSMGTEQIFIAANSNGGKKRGGSVVRSFASTASPVSEPTVAPEIQWAQEKALWDETKSLGEAGMRIYLEQYPEGKFSKVAEQLIQNLKAERLRATEAEDEPVFAANENSTRSKN